jgi:hypothetical protein
MILHRRKNFSVKFDCVLYIYSVSFFNVYISKPSSFCIEQAICQNMFIALKVSKCEQKFHTAVTLSSKPLRHQDRSVERR